MKLQEFEFYAKEVTFEFQDDEFDLPEDFLSIKELTSTDKEPDWDNAVEILNKYLRIYIIPSNLDVEQADTPFSEIKDWDDEILFPQINVQRLYFENDNIFPTIKVSAKIKLLVKPPFSSNDDFVEWQENNVFFDTVCTIDLEFDNESIGYSGDFGSGFNLIDEH